jgi:hypothetical protein
VARLNSLLNALTERTGAQESTSEGVSGAVGVDDLGRLEGVDGEGLGRGGGGLGNDGRGGSLGDDDDAGGELVVLGKGGELGGDGGDVLSLQARRNGKEESVNLRGEWRKRQERNATYVPVVSSGVSLGLGLVTDEDVNVGKDLVNLGLEELGNEGGGEVHGEGLQQDGASALRTEYTLLLLAR